MLGVVWPVWPQIIQSVISQWSYMVLNCSDLLGKILEMCICNKSGLICSVVSLLLTKDIDNT